MLNVLNLQNYSSDGSEPDPAPREDDPDETNNESAITVGDAMHTVGPRVRPCQQGSYDVPNAGGRASIAELTTGVEILFRISIQKVHT